MNSYLQVLRTYLGRLRFWLITPVYLLVAGFWTRPEMVNELNVLASVAVASTLACFVALHLRRQFGSAAAHLTPGFAAAHLAVGAVLSALLWIGVPAWQAWRGAMPAATAIAAHAPAGLLLALVIVWPRALMILAAGPVLVAWAATMHGRHVADRLAEWLTQDWPAISYALIALAAAAQVAAGWRLTKLGDQDAVSDDLGAHLGSSESVTGLLDEWVLNWRDAVVNRRLAHAGTGLWAIQRWRVPVATAWIQLALFPLCAGGAALIAYQSGADDMTIGGVLALVTAVFLLAPFSAWRGRRYTIGSELLRPVSRDQYFAEMAAALACDVAMWFALLSTATVASGVLFYSRHPREVVPDTLAHLAVLWALGVFLWGFGLLTMRRSYWLPILLIGTTLWSYVSVVVVVLALHYAHVFHSEPLLTPLCWALLSTLAGFLLALWARRRWAWADLA